MDCLDDRSFVFVVSSIRLFDKNMTKDKILVRLIKFHQSEISIPMKLSSSYLFILDQFYLSSMKSKTLSSLRKSENSRIVYHPHRTEIPQWKCKRLARPMLGWQIQPICFWNFEKLIWTRVCASVLDFKRVSRIYFYRFVAIVTV